jgi:lipopolysaccharide transport system ATP-binding protein
MSTAIRVEGVSKRYTINAPTTSFTLKEQIANGIDRLRGRGGHQRVQTDEEAALQEEHPEEFWALRDISFEVMEGERVGIIGANGAGKSTLLKILSRVTSPTRGRVEIHGKVASLLEVGTGFHPELTGRENVFLNGAILGMSREEVRLKFSRIVDFAGVGKFIDTPVKFYSSGMYVRLAFSVSAWLDPDILIVDEVLSVGDQAFQKRSAERIRELTKEGRTVLFVSHSMGLVNQMCQKALYLEHGRMQSYGAVEDTTIEYHRDVVAETEQDEGPWHRPEVVMPDERLTVYSERQGEVEFLSAAIYPVGGVPADKIALDRDLNVEIRYRVLRAPDAPLIPNLHLYDELGTRIFVAMPAKPAASLVGDHTCRCLIPAYQLNVGRFTAMPAMSSFSVKPSVHFAAEYALRFEITEDGVADPRRHGFVLPLPGYSRPRLRWTNA